MDSGSVICRGMLGGGGRSQEAPHHPSPLTNQLASQLDIDRGIPTSLDHSRSIAVLPTIESPTTTHETLSATLNPSYRFFARWH